MELKAEKLLLVLSFIYHSIVAWSFSRDFIHKDVMWVVINQVEALSRNPSYLFTNTVDIQYNFYTGNPFFFLPIFQYINLSPALIKTSLMFFMAASSVLAYLVMRSEFDFRESLLGILLLLNFDFWVAFRFADYTYSIFFSLFVFLLYQRWHRERSSRSLYLLAGAAGLFFYFKAMVGYICLAILAAHLLSRREVWKGLEPRNIAVAAVVFLVALSPFLALSFQTGFGYLDEVAEVDSHQKGDEPYLEYVLDKRLRDFLLITDFNSFPERDFPANYDLSPFSAVFPILLVLGLMSRRRFHAIFFLGLTALFLVTPHGKPWRQTVVFLPFMVMVSLAGYTRLKSAYSEFKWEKITVLLVLALYIGLALNVSSMADSKKELEWSEEYFAGSQEEYRSYRGMNVESDAVATNFYRLYLASKYDFRTRSYFLVSSDYRRHEGGWKPVEFKKEIAAGDDILRPRSINETLLRGNRSAALMLIRQPECNEAKEFCGAEIPAVKRYIDTDNWEENRFRNRTVLTASVTG